jgi:hypothetical protein
LGLNLRRASGADGNSVFRTGGEAIDDLLPTNNMQTRLGWPVLTNRHQEQGAAQLMDQDGP